VVIGALRDMPNVSKPQTQVRDPKEIDDLRSLRVFIALTRVVVA
jgi:hypothetical protein